MARAAGLDLGTLWTPELAQKSVTAYRTVNREIPQGWYQLDHDIHTAWMGKSMPVTFGEGKIITIAHGKVIGPDSFALNYDKPTFDPIDHEYKFRYGRFWHKIYGAKMMENIIQFLARQIIRNAALRIADSGYNFVLQAHDELVFIVRDAEVDKAKEIIHTEMTRRPTWAQTLPLKADIGVGQSYGETK